MDDFDSLGGSGESPFAQRGKLNFAVSDSINCIVLADLHAGAGREFGASLTNDDITGKGLLTARKLNAKTF